MKNRLLLLTIAVLLVAGLAGGATMALFTDTEANAGNAFAAGTIRLDVMSTPVTGRINISNMAPGDVSGYHVWVLRNTGTLPGRLSVTFSPITNNENDVVEPEIAAEGQFPAHPTDGELGQYLTTGVHPDDISLAALPYVEILERNDNEGWYIANVSEEVDTRGTIGWGPAGWTVPSRLFGQWQTGPPHPWGTPGLNHFGGRTFGTLAFLRPTTADPTRRPDELRPGEQVAFFLRAALARDLRRWDGTGWRAVDDNIIQSDSAHFDLTFRLESFPPQ